MYDLDKMYLSDDECAKLSEIQRVERVKNLIEESYLILESAIEEYSIKDNKPISCKCVLFSGGNDSTTLVYLFKDNIDHVVHINTGIGIEQTRDFVRNTCKDFGLDLREFTPDAKDSYESLVKEMGFPGPAHHYIMYQRLKERCIYKAKKELNPRYRRDRIVFIAGRRRSESKRRMNIPVMERQKNAIWVSPLYNWTKIDIETYRKLNPDIPRNNVSDLIHMSGECLCGSFAEKDEREEIRFFFPEMIEYIEKLEEEVRSLGKFEEKKCIWGWGSQFPKKQNKKIGMLCSSCESSAESEFETEKCSHKGPQFETENSPHKGYKTI